MTKGEDDEEEDDRLATVFVLSTFSADRVLGVQMLLEAVCDRDGVLMGYQGEPALTQPAISTKPTVLVKGSGLRWELLHVLAGSKGSALGDLRTWFFARETTPRLDEFVKRLNDKTIHVMHVKAVLKSSGGREQQP